MRTAFGRFAQELRLKKGINQKEFSDLVGLSLSHVSNIEHQRTNVSDEIVGAYIKILDCNGSEANELRKRASFSNELRKTEFPTSRVSTLQVMLSQFGSGLRPQALAKIQSIIENETGERVEALRFSSSQGRAPGEKSGTGRRTRPSLTPKKFAEIAVLAETTRSRVAAEMERVDIGKALERLCHLEGNLDYVVKENLPSHFLGAFACILGHAEGHTILLEEQRLLSAMKGVHFARHVIAHELAHHFLHSDQLKSNAVVFLEPQELARNTSQTFGSSGRIEQVVDTYQEVEAECFASLFLVPWTAFLKGTAPKFLASDYGEQEDEVKRYNKVLSQPAVIDALRENIWKRGTRQHPIFDR